MNKEDQYIARIHQAGGMLFRKRGFRSVSMDDIANETGMSKKTIYKYFDSKAKLIEVLVIAHIEAEAKNIAEIATKNKNPIQAMVEIGHLVYIHYKEMSPDVMIELKKYFYDIWQLVDKIQEEFMLEGITKNMKKGIELGLYRNEVDPEFITNVYVNSVITSCDREENIAGKEQYYLMLLEYHMYGVMTDKGRKQFNKLKAKLRK